MEIIYKERKIKTGPTFPILMKKKESNLIILFLGYTSGVIMRQDSSSKIGQLFSSNNMPCTDTTYWEKFTGEIILKND